MSVIATCLPLFKYNFLVVGSNVENNLDFCITFAPVIRFNNELLPAFVYPIKEIIGIPEFDLCFLCCFLLVFNLLRSLRSFCILCLVILLSVSICVSPGPLVPIPPPNLSKCDHWPASLGNKYSFWANSTCNLPSLLFAFCANISNIKDVLSMIFLFFNSFSIFLCCVGVNSWSQITVFAFWNLGSFLSSINLPCPKYVWLRFSRYWIADPTTVAWAVFASSPSSSIDSFMFQIELSFFNWLAIKKTFSVAFLVDINFFTIKFPYLYKYLIY